MRGNKNKIQPLVTFVQLKTTGDPNKQNTLTKQNFRKKKKRNTKLHLTPEEVDQLKVA